MCALVSVVIESPTSEDVGHPPRGRMKDEGGRMN